VVFTQQELDQIKEILQCSCCFQPHPEYVICTVCRAGFCLESIIASFRGNDEGFCPTCRQRQSIHRMPHTTDILPGHEFFQLPEGM